METIYANSGNCQSVINDVMRQMPAALLRRNGNGYIVSLDGVDAVRIVTYTQEAHFVGSGDALVCTSVGRAIMGG